MSETRVESKPVGPGYLAESQATPPTGSEAARSPAPITIGTIQKLAAQGEAFACLTCYDATTAGWLERAGVPVLLVGDSAANVILGLDRTSEIPLDFLITLTAAVKRGAPSTLVMADMPFMSYHADDAEGVRNAGRFLTEGKADLVKLEADASFAPLVEKMVRAGIPVCGHIGLLPQRVALTGRYQAAGRTNEAIETLVRDAKALEEAGCCMLLVEAVPDEAADAVLAATDVPVIGIGAGERVHGQILVIQDLLGLSPRPPRFADPVARMGPELEAAGREWVGRVRARSIGGERYRMRKGSE
ncbi:MAG: 3-methyl-2-oxobutanoate hydroxymethyltransferase [Planctomycetota bacterium]